jgi:hypothetical protein
VLSLHVMISAECKLLSSRLEMISILILVHLDLHLDIKSNRISHEQFVGFVGLFHVGATETAGVLN